MAINNTEQICFHRVVTNKSVKHTIPDEMPTNYDDPLKSVSYANK